MNSFTVVWDGAHNGRGDDSLLPPRDELPNPIWDENFYNVGYIEKLLFEDKVTGNYSRQRRTSMAERIRLHILERRRTR